MQPLTIDNLTFSRASQRTHPTTGATVAANVPIVETFSDIVPIAVADIAALNGELYLGKLSNGQHVYIDAASNLSTTPNGEPPLLPWLTNKFASVITPAGSLLRSNGAEPASIYRRSAADNYASETKVLDFVAGFPSWNSGYGHSLDYAAGGAYTSSGMSYASDGNTIWIAEYGNGAYKQSTTIAWRCVYRSDDDGATWTKCFTFPSLANLHIHALFYDAPTGNLYCSVGDLGASTASTIGIWKSTDRGNTFTLVPAAQQCQPVSAIRFNGYLLWGTDEAPTGVWLHNPATDALTRYSIDYNDSSSINWNGVGYWQAALGDYAVMLCTQSTDTVYHAYIAHKDDLTRWYKLVDSTAGWSRPTPRTDGALLIKPSDSVSTPATVKISGVERRSWPAFWTDQACSPFVTAAAPWTVSTGAVIAGAGPNGLDVYRVGSLTTAKRPVTAGARIEMSTYARNPLGISSGSLIMQVTWYTAANAVISQFQRAITFNLMDASEWRWFRVYRDAPANATQLDLRFFWSGTYNASTAYFELAGPTVNDTMDQGYERYTRVAESAYVDKSAGASWAVFDRAWPRWDYYLMQGNRTLLTVSDLDTGAAWSVVYDATAQGFSATNGATTVAGAAVRCMGRAGPTCYFTQSGLDRRNFAPADWPAYGVRVTAGAAQLVVWDRINRTAQTYSLGTFAAARLRITFPGSGVAHAPIWVDTAVADSDLFDLLLRGVWQVAARSLTLARRSVARTLPARDAIVQLTARPGPQLTLASRSVARALPRRTAALTLPARPEG